MKFNQGSENKADHQQIEAKKYKKYITLDNRKQT
jgi:hypothetical protein